MSSPAREMEYGGRCNAVQVARKREAGKKAMGKGGRGKRVAR